jgi:hypothetical protein
MKKYLRNISFLFLIGSTGIVKCDAQDLQQVRAGFDKYNQTAPQEKLFVHTDKSTYTAGELMWFKLYYVDGTYNRPADMSKVAYVEILDNNQDAIVQCKIALKDGVGSGSAFIPVNLSSGNYLLRAYTGWMKNFSPDFYFHKQISIVNPLKVPEPAVKIPVPEYDIQFFPEGGNLVKGLTSTVGVKTADQWGKSVAFKGAILNKNNDTVARFTDFKFGTGRFSFKPDDAAGYHAVINIGGKLIEKDLPRIFDSGYVMSVANENNGRLTVTVNTNTTTSIVYLFVHTRGEVKDVEAAAVDKGSAHFSIDNSKLGDGISHFTIFNNDRQPVCERLYFKRPAKQLAVNAGSDQLQYNTRKKATITINTKDGQSKPVTANLSLSVYRIDSLQHLDSGDIQSYLWLTSDLKGNIESPGYYFSNNNAETDEAIDNLMLTQGWRRFDWDSILQNKTPAFNFLPEYNGPIISGELTNQQSGKAQKDIITYLAIPGKRVQMYAASSDSLGRLIFNMKDFFGPGEIVVQNNTNIDTIYHIDILSPFSDQYAKITLPPLNIESDAQSDVQHAGLNLQVRSIYSGEKMRQFYALGTDTSAFYGPPFKTYLLDNYTRFTTMEEVMREYVTEVNIVHPRDGFHIKVISPNGFLHENDPMVLIDGIPFFNINKLFAVDPLKIRKLEDVPFTYYWGPSAEEGIFSFTSYKGDLAGTEIDPHAVVMDYEGLEQQRIFYAPAYDTDKAYNSRIPDFRDVLYWSPNVNTDANGKNSLSFYTSDQTGKYIAIIQGMAADGTAASQVFTFQVVK